ncbi:MAG: DUF411 domain-containing protein [Gemmatimonadales bacterium]
MGIRFVHSRRWVLTALVSASLVVAAAARPSQTSPRMMILKNAGCTCCDRWAAHLERLGFDTQIVITDTLPAAFASHGVVPAHQSCHLGLVEDYVVVGHVPGEEVLRLLEDRSEVLGITVPGMPVGSPGMEVAGLRASEYEVLLIVEEGVVATTARYRGTTRLQE